MKQLKSSRGVTLVEMMVVVAVIGLMAGISFPAVSNGLDSIRLHSAADSVAAFLNAAMNRAERRQEVVEVAIEPAKSRIALYSTAPGFSRILDLPDSIALAGESERRVFLVPGGSFPPLRVDLVNRKGLRRSVAIEPITGAPRISSSTSVTP